MKQTRPVKAPAHARPDALTEQDLRSAAGGHNGTIIVESLGGAVTARSRLRAPAVDLTAGAARGMAALPGASDVSINAEPRCRCCVRSETRHPCGWCPSRRHADSRS